MTSQERVTPAPYGPKGREMLLLTEAQQRFYRDIGENRTARKLARELIVKARTGRAFTVDQGQVLRVECHEDTQVADFDVFNRQNPKEHFSSSQTRSVHGSHMTVGDRLWSHPIYERPMMTIVADTMDEHQSPGSYRRRGVAGAFREFPDERRRKHATQLRLGGDGVVRGPEERGLPGVVRSVVHPRGDRGARVGECQSRLPPSA